jgi:predicted amino acid racemase
MSYITLDKTKLAHNYRYLSALFAENHIEWAVVVKMLCGNRMFLEPLLDLISNDVCDSRLSNLKIIKQLSPGTQTIYIKPPAKRLARSIVAFADVSFNTEIETLKLLSKEAVKQRKLHKVILVIELGELREGIMGINFLKFFEEVMHLPGIHIIGIGANLNCFNGILPDREKMELLISYKKLVEKQFTIALPYVSGGSSVTVPLLFSDEIPIGINHFRVGETLFFGTDVYHNTFIDGMENDVFTLTAEIIELREKPMVPSGNTGLNLTGDKVEFPEENIGRTSVRAIVDIGLLDIDFNCVVPLLEDVEVLGGSSDMLILNLAENQHNLKVGDTVDFRINYLATLRAMNSDYVDKVIKNHSPGEAAHALNYHK